MKYTQFLILLNHFAATPTMNAAGSSSTNSDGKYYLLYIQTESLETE